jgi:diguanylate cyclase (GGDEF)-like protein
MLLLAPAALHAETEYTVADGLSQNAVNALARDDDGFLWIGTEDGLNRFDGYEFQVHRPEAAAAGFIRDIAVSGRHLFLATNGGGLAVFDRVEEHFRLIGAADGLPVEHFTAVALAGTTTLYLGSRNGLLRLQWQGDPMSAAMEVTAIAIGDGRERTDVWELHAGPSGMWVASGDGVFRIDSQGRVSELEIAGVSRPFNTDALLEFPAGVLWVGSWSQGLFRLELASGATRRFLPGGDNAPGLRTERALSLAAGPGGTVFVGTDRGVVWFDPDCACLKALDHRRSARTAGRGFMVLALQADPHGGVFAGFWGEGLVRFTPHDRVFHVERQRDEGPPGLIHNRVRALLEDRDGALWVGTFGGGVQRVAADRRGLGAPWHFETLPFGDALPEPSRLVWNLIQDRAGRIWAATDDGVYWADPAADPDRIVWQRERPLGEPVPMPGIRMLLEDHHGRIWVASSSGLGRIDRPGAPRQRLSIAEADGEIRYRRQDDSLHGLLQDAERRLWVGTSAGLHILDPDGRVLARYRVADGLPGPVVWNIYRHVDGSLWLATSGGLARVVRDGNEIEGLQFDNVSARLQLPHSGVFGVTGDRDGRLWITGNRGLIRLDPATSRYRVWTRGEGIASDEFTINALTQGGDNRLYLGGADGITAFDPLALREQLEPPRPTLARAEIDGRRLRPHGASGPLSLRLPHDHAPAILDFTGLVFDTPASARYAYRLRADAGFTELGARRSLILDRLPYGQHLLELAVDNQGLRETRTMLAIEVVPPLTATWPFRIVLAFGLTVLLALLYLWRVRELTRQRRLLESQVSTRTRELRAQKEALEATAEALVVANDKLKALSVIDTLTGLPNRRGLIQQVEAALCDVRPDAGPALALIDLDHFKQINDQYGHLVGDDVLRDFAQLASAGEQPEVMVGRWGGEEFLAVFPADQAAAAPAWAERLLQAVRGRRVVHGSTSIGYRISIGIAHAVPGDSMDSVLARADQAMYASKAEGRDRVEIAGRPE